MYFVANSDDNFDATNTMYTELENEYKDKINFQLVNVDENPEALENFSLVKDQTPALIMLDTSNNISAIEFKCSDKDKLKTDIDNAHWKIIEKMSDTTVSLFFDIIISVFQKIDEKGDCINAEYKNRLGGGGTRTQQT